jgi:hypothetical protein
VRKVKRGNEEKLNERNIKKLLRSLKKHKMKGKKNKTQKVTERERERGRERER